MTPRRTGRPSRRGGRKAAARARAAARAAAKKEVKKEDKESVKEEVKAEEQEAVVPKAAEAAPAPAKNEPRKKKRSLLGLDIDDAAIITATADGDTPVRQSRRIAQIKIKEEAERRKAEEVALLKLKEASEKKKKGPSGTPRSASEEENSESERKLDKKKKKKKENKERPWQTDSSDSSERDEEDVDEQDEVERLPPLKSDHEFSPESDIEDESQIVPTKRARTARKDVTEKDAEESEDEDIHACQKCTKNDHPEWILLCDKCDKGYHCSCLIPVLFVIPEGNWFCPPCQQDKLIGELETRLVAFDTVVKAKELEEQRQQRILFNTINEANVLKESKRDKQRARAEQKGRKYHDSEEYSTSSSSDGSDDDANDNASGSNAENSKRSNSHRPRKRSESSATNSSDDEPIYKLRKRRQAAVSYRFNEYDELINRAIKSEMDEVAGAGNLGRGKDISTIIEADKEERRLKKEADEKTDDEAEDNKDAKSKHSESNSDSEPIRPKVIKRSGAKQSGKKKKKLNSLDDESDYDEGDSDDDFKNSSFSEDEEENYSESSADSESSLEPLSRRGKKGRTSARRSVRQRKKRFDADFIDDNSDDDDDIPLSKKKRKEDSEYSDFNDSSEEEVEEDVDSEDLCDDSTDESDRPWERSGKSKKPKSASKPAPANPVQKKKPRNEDERPFKASAKKKPAIASDDDDDEADEVLPKSRRTRGKKLPFLLDEDFDSSDDGIKPGVKRPDTPPEERAAFIQKQEEIKRMLAEKSADKPQSEKPKRNPPKDSLSTIPANIIQTAKALDVDLKKGAALNRSDNDSNGFDDDLPEDFDPEDMDEDEIAKMMEEEEFAQHQLKLAGEAIRSKKNKEVTDEKKELPPMKIDAESAALIPPHLNSIISPTVFASALTIPDIPPSMYNVQSTSASSKISTTPKKRGRKLKDEVPPAVQNIPKVAKSLEPAMPQKEAIPLHTPTIQHTSMQQQKPPQLLHGPPMHSPPMHSPPIQIPQSVISHSSLIRPPLSHQPSPLSSVPSIGSPSSSSLLGIARSQEPIIPSTILNMQNTRLLDPSELGQPPNSAPVDPSLLDSPAKKRGRRKKFTPTKEQPIAITAGVDMRNAAPPSLSTSAPAASVIVPEQSKASSILSERLTANPNKGKTHEKLRWALV